MIAGDRSLCGAFESHGVEGDGAWHGAIDIGVHKNAADVGLRSEKCDDIFDEGGIGGAGVAVGEFGVGQVKQIGSAAGGDEEAGLGIEFSALDSRIVDGEGCGAVAAEDGAAAIGMLKFFVGEGG